MTWQKRAKESVIEITSQPVFGVTLTLAAYFIGLMIYNRTKSVIWHPMLIALVIIIFLLLITGIPYENYNKGGELFTFLLGPATVALAIPMYKKLELLKKKALLILSVTFAGAAAGVFIVIGLGLVAGAARLFIVSAIPKSVTTPIAVGIADQVGGLPSITVSMTILHGLLGGMFGPQMHRLLKIRTGTARGLTMGMLSHGLGTARALENSELEGSLAGLSIGLMGFFTALTAPALIAFLL